MRVIPVLDLAAGRAVAASRGRRHAYRPVRSVLVPEAAPGDPGALARAFRDVLSSEECYVADLDAIAGDEPQRSLLAALARQGGRLLVDRAVATPERARAVLEDGAARVVVGLETLPSFAALARVASAIGPERVVFSLDLRDGTPVLSPGAPLAGPPVALVGRAVAAGARAILVLDLARVGTRRGVDRALVGTIRDAFPHVGLLVGGGIGSRRELEQLADAGIDGALVATALHDGRLSPGDVEAVRHRGAGPRGAHATDSR